MDSRDARAHQAEEVVRAIYIAGEDLLGESQRRAPVEEGTLRASAALAMIVNGTRFEGAGGLAGAIAMARELADRGTVVRVDAEVSFNTVYAARQHEELGWQHPKGGQAKYLESALVERSGRYNRLVEAAAR